MGSWLDDLQTRAQQSLDNAENSVQSYFDNKVSDPNVINSVFAGKANQTAAQIAAGQPNTSKPIAPPSASPASIMNSAGFLMKPVAAFAGLPLIVLLGVGYFFFIHKRS